jgi:hypothetical protein
MNPERTFIIADPDSDERVGHRFVDMNAPLPLGYANALRRALQLRTDHGFSYRTIAIVMREYHGIRRGNEWWKRELRKQGVPAKSHGDSARFLRRTREPSGLRGYLSGLNDGPGGVS